jgi:hypothetical protein
MVVRRSSATSCKRRDRVTDNFPRVLAPQRRLANIGPVLRTWLLVIRVCSNATEALTDAQRPPVRLLEDKKAEAIPQKRADADDQ